MTDTDVELLWRPDPTRDNGMTAFRSWLSGRGHDFPDYESLWEWSVSDLEGFWGAIASYFDVRFHTAPERVLGSAEMPGAEWFPGSICQLISSTDNSSQPEPEAQEFDITRDFGDGLGVHAPN